MQSRLTLLTIFGLTLLVFHRIFFFETVNWDDPILVFGNPSLKLSFFEALLFNFTNFYHGDYLPLSQISHWLDQNLFGLSVGDMHGLNLLIHLGSIFLVFRILQRLKFSWFVVAGVSLIFGIHPLQVESVVWLSERKGLLSAFFLLLSILLLISKKPIPAGGSYILSMLCKMNGVLFPVLFWGRKRVFVVGICMMSAFIGVRILAFGEVKEELFSSIFSPDRLTESLKIFVTSLGHYLNKLLFPQNLSIIYDEKMINYNSLALGLGALIVGGVECWRRRKDGISFWIPVFFALGILLPVLNLIPRNSLANDRHMYLPIVGWSLFLLSGFERHFFSRSKIWVLGILTLALGFASFNRSLVWKDNFSLWSETTRTCPNCYIAWNNLGLEKQSRGDLVGAQSDFERVISSDSGDQIKVLAYNNLAILFANPKNPIQDLERAIRLLEDGQRLAVSDQEKYELQLNLAFYLKASGKEDQAVSILEILLKKLSQDVGLRSKILREHVESLLGTSKPH